MDKRHLVMDLGNTRLKLGVFHGNELVYTERRHSSEASGKLWEEWKQIHTPDRIALSTTSNLIEKQTTWLEKNHVLSVSSKLDYPFEIQYKTPETLGQDRLAAITGAYALYRRQNVLVIDSGTCITYDFLSADGHYIGGNIAPGIRMRLLSMYHYTDKLPLVHPPEKELGWIGQSTEEALRNGGSSMAVLEANGMIFYLREKYGHLTTILTGGDAWYFENHLKGVHYLIPDLVLMGLNEILKNNEV